MAAITGSFIDELRSECAADDGRTQAICRGLDLHGADQFAMLFFKVEHAGAGAERTEYVKQRGPCGVESQSVEDQAGTGKECGSAQEECGRGKISRHHGVDGLEPLAAFDRNKIDAAMDLRAERFECDLAMVAGANAFA